MQEVCAERMLERRRVWFTFLHPFRLEHVKGIPTETKKKVSVYVLGMLLLWRLPKVAPDVYWKSLEASCLSIKKWTRTWSRLPRKQVSLDDRSTISFMVRALLFVREPYPREKSLSLYRQLRRSRNFGHYAQFQKHRSVFRAPKWNA